MKDKILTAALAAVTIFALVFTACGKQEGSVSSSSSESPSMSAAGSADGVVGTRPTMLTDESQIEKDDSCFLVYLGMYDEDVFDDDNEKYPLYDYYYPSDAFKDNGYAHIVMIDKSITPATVDFKYGDIINPSNPLDIGSFNIKDPVDDEKTDNPFASVYELPQTQLTRIGNIRDDIFSKETLTVTKSHYWNSPNGEFSTLTLKDANGDQYSFNFRHIFDGKVPLMHDACVGDRAEFAIYKGNAIMPISEVQKIEYAPEDQEEEACDFKEDEFLVYGGRTGASAAFFYYRPGKEGGLEKTPLIYSGSLPSGTRYGDLFVPEGKVKITQTESEDAENPVRNVLDSSTKLKAAGNCFEIMQLKDMIYSSMDYMGRGWCFVDLVDTDYQYKYSFGYNFNVFDTSVEGESGDIFQFAFYKNKLILPVQAE